MFHTGYLLIVLSVSYRVFTGRGVELVVMVVVACISNFHVNTQLGVGVIGGLITPEHRSC